MSGRLLEQLDIEQRLIFLRNDFNVPLDGTGGVSDDTRIRASLKTIQFLLDGGARVICCSHLGRPKGKRIEALSLKPVAERLARLLGREIFFNGEIRGSGIEAIKSRLKPGQILLLENIRFEPGESRNDEELAQDLALQVDIYVNDAFAACHRAHSSIAKITDSVPVSCTGFLLEKEIEYLSMAVENPPDNFVVILGGAKVSDKIPVIQGLMERADAFLIGGAMAYSFLHVQGVNVGASLVDSDSLDICRTILDRADRIKIPISLPVDHLAAARINPDETVHAIRPGMAFPPDLMGLDIGAETIQNYESEIMRAEMIVWNGPMGVFELDDFASGTVSVARAVARSDATSIVGGGDSVSALNRAGMADQISHVSTGGGASLEFLAGKKLPGIVALSEGI